MAKDLSYLIGRLQGLNELVKILKGVVDKDKNADSEMVKVMTDHVAEQLTSILSDLDEIGMDNNQQVALADIKAKHVMPNEPESKDEEEISDLKDDAEGAESKTDEPAPDEEQKPADIDQHQKTVDDLLHDLEAMQT